VTAHWARSKRGITHSEPCPQCHCLNAGNPRADKRSKNRTERRIFRTRLLRPVTGNDRPPSSALSQQGPITKIGGRHRAEHHRGMSATLWRIALTKGKAKTSKYSAVSNKGIRFVKWPCVLRHHKFHCGNRQHSFLSPESLEANLGPSRGNGGTGLTSQSRARSLQFWKLRSALAGPESRKLVHITHKAMTMNEARPMVTPRWFDIENPCCAAAKRRRCGI